MAALILRLLFLIYLGHGEVGGIAASLSPDSANYIHAADQIRNDFDLDTKGVIIFGPGYPAFLALAGDIFGSGAVALTIAQTFFGAGVSVLLVIFIFLLWRRPDVAIVGGVLNAISPSAIRLSGSILSETIFIFALLLGLILILKGLEKDNLTLFMASGFVLSYAAFCRGVMQYFPLLLVLYLVFERPNVGKMTRSVSKSVGLRPFVAIAILLFGIVGWTIHNQQTYGFGYLSFAGPTTLYRTTAQINARAQGISYREGLDQMNQKLMARPDYKSEYYRAYYEFVKNEFPKAVLNHPLTTAKLVAAGLIRPIPFIKAIPILAIGVWGMLLIWRRKEYAGLFLLLALAAYFFAASRFILSQGYRADYPAEVFWTAFVARGVIDIFARIRERFMALKYWPVV